MKWWTVRRSFTLVELLVVIVIIGILIALLTPGSIGQPIFVLLFGWAIFLYQTLPNVTIDWLACAQAAVAVVLLTAVAHTFLRWLYNQNGQTGQTGGAEAGEAGGPRRWKFRWTAFSLVGVVFLFVAGIAVTGLAHQVGWLMASDEKWWTMSGNSAMYRSMSTNNLKQIGLGFHNYHDSHEGLPPGGTFNEFAEMQHGWVTALLPYIEYGHLEVDFSVPWDHPNNREAMQTRVDPVHNFAISREAPTGPQGYSLAHYAANSRLVGGGKRMRLSDIADGQSNTILAGEVIEGFKPWGHPLNWRDPTVGLNVPGGFGAPRQDGTILFLMADGSVQHVTAQIDPTVLRALATPSAGEDVKESPWAP